MKRGGLKGSLAGGEGGVREGPGTWSGGQGERGIAEDMEEEYEENLKRSTPGFGPLSW